MYEFLQTNALYLVLFISLLGWAGIFFYLRKLDRKVKQLEKQST